MDDLNILRATRMHRVMNKLKSVSVSIVQSVLATYLYLGLSALSSKEL